MKALLISLYDIVFFLVIILTFCIWILLQLVVKFSNQYNSVKYLGLRLIPSNNFFLEFVWTLIPMFIFIFIFLPLLKLLSFLGFFFHLDRSSEKTINRFLDVSLENFDIDFFFNKDAFRIQEKESLLTIKCIGNQWYWIYEDSSDLPQFSEFTDDNLFSYLVPTELDPEIPSYKNLNLNFSSIEDYWSVKLRLLSTDFWLILPHETLIQLFITSYDVIHNWCLPSAGIKVDACPGRIASVKFKFTDTGFYYGQCSELCGFLHGFMPIMVKVV